MPSSGRVVRAATGEPVTDFSLQVEGKDSHPFSRRFLDQDGRFTLAELEDDTYDIEAIGSSGAVSDVRTPGGDPKRRDAPGRHAAAPAHGHGGGRGARPGWMSGR